MKRIRQVVLSFLVSVAPIHWADAQESLDAAGWDSTGSVWVSPDWGEPESMPLPPSSLDAHDRQEAMAKTSPLPFHSCRYDIPSRHAALPAYVRAERLLPLLDRCLAGAATDRERSSLAAAKALVAMEGGDGFAFVEGVRPLGHVSILWTGHTGKTVDVAARLRGLARMDTGFLAFSREARRLLSLARYRSALSVELH